LSAPFSSSMCGPLVGFGDEWLINTCAFWWFDWCIPCLLFMYACLCWLTMEEWRWRWKQMWSCHLLVVDCRCIIQNMACSGENCEAEGSRELGGVNVRSRGMRHGCQWLEGEGKH
jgi:hypothetical protein